MISMVVVLPAPFGPSRPKQIPSDTLNETPSTAVTEGYSLTSLRTSRMGSLTLQPVVPLTGALYPYFA